MTGKVIDTRANRSAQKWTRKELLGRLVWEMSVPLFAWSPRQFWGWRNFLLRTFGAKIGRGVRIFPSVRIAIPWNLDIGENAAIGDSAILYSLGKIEIGASATVSQYAHLCAGTHDYLNPGFPLIKEAISVGDGAWVAANAFVGPGVKIGPFAILGACGVATRHVPEGTIWIGNPAIQIKTRSMPLT